MSQARTILASVVILGSTLAPAFAQDGATGLLTKVDRINGTVAIRKIETGTVGANAAEPVEYKVQDRAALDAVHAGDRVTYSASEAGGTRTVTKLQRQ